MFQLKGVKRVKPQMRLKCHSVSPQNHNIRTMLIIVLFIFCAFQQNLLNTIHFKMLNKSTNTNPWNFTISMLSHLSQQESFSLLHTSLRSKKVLSKGKYKNIFNWIFIALESSCTAKVKSMKEKTLTWSSSPNWLVVV